MNIVINRPQKKDEGEIKELFTTVITQNFKYYGLYKKYHDDIAYQVGKQAHALEEYFETLGQKVYFLVAKDNNKIVGTIAYGKPSADIEKFYPEKPDNIPEIKSLYILPEYQGKGTGTKLLKELMKELQRKGFKEFCLYSGYPKSQQFWTKRLGEPLVRIINRWGDGNDCLIWHYNL